MASIAGLISHTAQQTPIPATANPTANASDSGSGSDSGSNSASITANDFLTLLVTELQNQDPTANNDPNAYINQLIGVNSLQQLISINETLSGAMGTSSTANSDRQAPGAMATSAVEHAPSATSGNLSVPHASAAAQRVANSLTTPRS